MQTGFQQGLIDRFRSLPIARSAVVAGRIVADVLRTGLGTVITVAVGVAFGFRLHASVVGTAAALGLILAWGLRAQLTDGLPRRLTAWRGDCPDGRLPAGDAARLRQPGIRARV
jgi:ABC-type transport system involved in cytochrome c biogenesis permease component